MMPEDEDAQYLKTLTVLLVEDDPGAQEEIGIFLRRRVGRLLTAPNGAAGLAAFAAQRPGIVVTDIQMPIMDGLAMVQELRVLEPLVPVIITTAFEHTDYLVHAIELGVDRYVLKPIQAGPLEQALRACAHRLRAESELRLKVQREAELVEARHEASRGLLLGGLAHDYNNLVQAILTAVNLAGLTLAPDHAGRGFMALAERSSEEACLLSRRLSSLTRGPEVMTRVGPVASLVRAAVTASLVGSGTALQFEGQGEGLAVRYHPANLGLVLRTLTENAREAMADGGTFRVVMEACGLPEGHPLKLPSGRYLRIACLDTGQGFAPEHQALLFDPYFTTKPRGCQRGTGLGLALAQAMVRAHGGAISAESQSGQGAVFVVHLPLAEQL